MVSYIPPEMCEKTSITSSNRLMFVLLRSLTEQEFQALELLSKELKKCTHIAKQQEFLFQSKGRVQRTTAGHSGPEQDLPKCP